MDRIKHVLSHVSQPLIWRFRQLRFYENLDGNFVTFVN